MKKLLFLIPFSLFLCAARASSLPQILSESDVAVYTEIFQLQTAEKIDAAKKLDATIEDKILMQEVLFQRYTSKTYKSRGVEIVEWMKSYYDQPGADRMHKLAQIKKTSARAPKLPTLAIGTGDTAAKSETWTTKNYGGDAGVKIKKFKNSLTHGNTKNARLILEEKGFKKSVSNADWGRLAGRLAFVYYTNGEFDWAKKFGEQSAEQLSEYGLWTMGLMAFKDGEFSDSLAHFESLTELQHINDARKIEAAFWAGRAAEMSGSRDIAKKHWKTAAEKPQMFYGALSAAMLGQTPKYKFFDKEYSDEDIEELSNTGYGKTALALLQIGDKVAAEKYLRLLLTHNASDKLLHAVYSVASSEELPRVSMQAAGLVRDRGIMEIDNNVIFSAQYPLPDWEPMGGWSIDRALLFAITRQESGFKATAESNKGAKGVMQLMPKTAKQVAKRNDVSMSDLNISKPEHNMFLGQQYIVDLLGLPNVENNIIKMLASYNSGNGAMAKFEKNFETSDPLLYIESFPNVETRNYIKRVISNLWLYRARLKQPLTSLEDLANGKWPLYSSEDEFVRNQIARRTI
ncbi:MAG: lytic transglycosylase domain-containing protein [Alphaproteobacteria bacterium]|nr:lytic transglycosylase domain-containing protein [Alphaproteobacteria bacterium]